MNKRLIYTNADGGVSIVVPNPHAQRDGESDADFLARLAAREIANGAAASAADFAVVEGDPRPSSRAFRNAWKWDGAAIKVNMPAARGIHMDRIREIRNARLDALDKDWSRAKGQKKEAEADAVEAKRQKLRDIPQTLDLTTAATPEALGALWPAELIE